jgi:hypothetical protein
VLGVESSFSRQEEEEEEEEGTVLSFPFLLH